MSVTFSKVLMTRCWSARSRSVRISQVVRRRLSSGPEFRLIATSEHTTSLGLDVRREMRGAMRESVSHPFGAMRPAVGSGRLVGTGGPSHPSVADRFVESDAGRCDDRDAAAG